MERFASGGGPQLHPRRPCCSSSSLVWPLLYQSGYAMRIMTTGGLFTMLTVAVVIILGQAGQLSFGHSAFYGIGAYTAAHPHHEGRLPHASRPSSSGRWSPGSSP